jgi:hypothetical protein
MAALVRPIRVVDCPGLAGWSAGGRAVHRLVATQAEARQSRLPGGQLCRSLVGRRFALGLLRQPDELRHDDGGIEHSEQRRE